MSPHFRLIPQSLVLVIASLGLHASFACAQDISGAASTWPNFYSNNQAEQLLDQGRAALSEADHDSAVRLVADALQIIRVNHGLRSARQIEPLQLLIAAHFQARNWDAADEQIDYFRWLNARNYSQDFPAYLAGSKALSDLLLAASADPQNPVAVRYLVAAKNQNWRTISAIEAWQGQQSPALIPWLYQVVHNHYQQSALIRRRGLTSFEFHSDADALVSGFRLRKNESLDMSYNIGQELLQRIESLLPDDPDARALIAVHQADWELIYGEYSAAHRLYLTSRQRMQDAGRSDEEITAFFRRAVIIPQQDLQTSWPDDASSRAIAMLAWSPLYPGVPSPLADTKTAPDTTPLLARMQLIPPQYSLASDSADRLGLPWRMELEKISPDHKSFRELIRKQTMLLQLRPIFDQQEEWYSLEMQLSAHFLADESLADLPGLNPAEPAASATLRDPGDEQN